jgi:hypothetical protein
VDFLFYLLRPREDPPLRPASEARWGLFLKLLEAPRCDERLFLRVAIAFLHVFDVGHHARR